MKCKVDNKSNDFRPKCSPRGKYVLLIINYYYYCNYSKLINIAYSHNYYIVLLFYPSFLFYSTGAWEAVKSIKYIQTSLNAGNQLSPIYRSEHTFKTKTQRDKYIRSGLLVYNVIFIAACPQVFSSGGTCTLLPSFLGVQCTL